MDDWTLVDVIHGGHSESRDSWSPKPRACAHARGGRGAGTPEGRRVSGSVRWNRRQGPARGPEPARTAEEDDDRAEAVLGQENYARWNEARSAAVAQASRASIQVQTVTAVAGSAVSSGLDLTRVQVDTVQRAVGERPSGRRFGTLVHAVLATIDLDATADRISVEAEANGRLMDATREEIDATVTAVHASLSHPLIRRAAISVTAGWLRRETPIQFLRNDGTLIEGVVDLAFREQTSDFNGWTVVDFKTDREIENKRDQYAAQVAAYVEAISRSTASPARGFLLVV
jgi:ATP-dependent helicase/nuclease subunit A